MIVQFTNLKATVISAKEEEHAWLRAILSFPDEKARFRRNGRFVGNPYIRLYNMFDKTFPSGLLPVVRKNAYKENFTVDLLDKRVKPSVGADPNYDMSWLRDYQQEAVERAIKKSRGIIKLPTASGKGSIAAALMAAIPINWVFMVNRTQIAKEISERFGKQSGKTETVGLIGEGQWTTGRITCASFKSLYDNLETPKGRALLSAAEGIVVDECHGVGAQTMYKVTGSTPNAFYRIGLSATPLSRGDKKNLLVIASTGPIIYEVRANELIEKGFISRPKIKAVKIQQVSSKPTWQGVYGECIVRSKKRNKAVVTIALKASSPGFIFVKEVKHGNILQKMCEQSGLRTKFIWGKYSTEKREEAIEKLVRTDLDFIICSAVFGEGIDCPSLKSVIIASGGKSTIQALQKIGRGMRIDDSTNKDTFEVYDIYDEGQKWLEKHSKARCKAFIKEGFDVIVADSLAHL